MAKDRPLGEDTERPVFFMSDGNFPQNSCGMALTWAAVKTGPSLQT